LNSIVSRSLWFLRLLRAVTRLEIAALKAHRLALLIRALGMAMAGLTLLFVSRFVGAVANPHLAVYGSNYLGFLVIGFLGTQFQQLGVSVVAERIRFAQMTGGLESELATPAPAWMILAASPTVEFSAASLRSVAYLFAAWLVLGLDLSHARLSSLALGVPIVIAAFGGLGLVTAATTMLVRRINPIAMVLGSLSLFLSGVLYPTSVLPTWLRGVGNLLPLTHALKILRGALLTGASPSELRDPLLALLTFTITLSTLGFATFSYAIRRARIDGSLTYY